MADKTSTKAPRSRGSALDLPMSLLMGGAVAFAAFAMPADLFEGLIAGSGLPGLVPAAQPPLGATARLAFVAGSALLASALVWSLLRALSRPKPRKAPVERQATAPRLRRADMHPDAPARAPIRAGSDLGVPLDSIDVEQREAAVDMSEVENVDFEAEWQRPTPAFLRPADATSSVEPALLPSDEEVADWSEPAAEVQAQAEPEVSPVQPGVLPFWPVEPEAEPIREDKRAEGATDVSGLLTRLEGGIIRRKRDGSAPRRRGAKPLDDRLRSALDDLGRMSRRS